MHPVVILAPALALIFVPRLWVGHVLKRHNQRDLPGGRSARDLARELLDKNRLQTVKVQSTDMGDHYDPQTKSVRLSRDKIDRRTLTALTTAAHEVSHALQDASGYAPFVWRTRLVKVAQGVGEVGSVLFLTVPIAAIFFRHPIPPILIGSVALAMLGAGVIAQLAALPSEIDASFGRAMPMLRDGYIGERQAEDARKILLACSLTYVASSLVAVLHIWPWIGQLSAGARDGIGTGCVALTAGASEIASYHLGTSRSPMSRVPIDRHRRRTRRQKRASALEAVIRPIGKPLIRVLLRAVGTA